MNFMKVQYVELDKPTSKIKEWNKIIRYIALLLYSDENSLQIYV